MKNSCKAIIVFLCVCLLTLCAFSVSADGISNNSNGIISDGLNGSDNTVNFPDHFGDRITESELYGDYEDTMDGVANNGRGRAVEGNLAGDENGRLIDDEYDDGVYGSYAGANAREVGRGADNNSGFNYLGLVVGALIALGVLGVVIYFVARKTVREE